jgi:hypothetical protein
VSSASLQFWPFLRFPYSAWDEIHDVFGDGHDYDWALEVEDEPNLDEESRQPAKFTDVSVQPEIFMYVPLIG